MGRPWSPIGEWLPSKLHFPPVEIGTAHLPQIYGPFVDPALGTHPDKGWKIRFPLLVCQEALLKGVPVQTLRYLGRGKPGRHLQGVSIGSMIVRMPIS